MYFAMRMSLNFKSKDLKERHQRANALIKSALPGQGSATEDVGFALCLSKAGVRPTLSYHDPVHALPSLHLR